MTTWDVVIHDPITGSELALEQWNTITLTDNFEGTQATIEVPGARAELGSIIELRTDLLFYSNKTLAYRLKVMDAEDNFTTEGHVVTLTAQSYEYVLARRALFADYETKTGTPPVSAAIPQHEIAWQLIDYTQKFSDLGIRKSGTWTGSTRTQDRVIQKGKTIVEAINEAASIENGFDWWIDQEKKLHAQTPRLLYETGLDLIWGGRVATVQRSSASDTYNSVVYVIGATTETVIGTVTYQPPAPALRQLVSRPLGRWERIFVHGDLVTQASVNAKADWYLADSSSRRATYNIGLSPGIWTQAIRPGGLVSLRVRSPPRVDFRVRCRIEEVTIALSADGAEDVTLATRSETQETEITPTPQAVMNVPVIEPLAETSPPGAVSVDITEITGRSSTVARTTKARELGAMLKDIFERLVRTERDH